MAAIVRNRLKQRTNRSKFGSAFVAVMIVSLAACGSTTSSVSSTSAAPPLSTRTTPPSTSPASATDVPQTPAEAAIFQSIESASKITALPSNLDPPLESFASPAQAKTVRGTWYLHGCDANNNSAEAASPTPCILGDTQSAKTIVLVGDSNVGNFAPGLDVGLGAAGYRLVIFGNSACPTPDLVYPSPSYGVLSGAGLADCNEWHQQVPKAISALHPVAVIAASGSTKLPVITDKDWIAGFTKLFAESTAGSPSAVRILLGTSPFPGPTPNCLAANSNPQACALHDSPGSGSHYATYLARDPLIASAASATLIPTYPWFCSAGTCSPVISNYLVFADVDHTTIAYSKYLAPVSAGAVTRALAGHP
jgi:hypothetical protein